MSSAAVVDTNLLTLLVVGSASRKYISSHKRLRADFNVDHFELLVELLGAFDEIVLLPQVVAETSNLLRQIDVPARHHIQTTFRTLIESASEFPLTSRQAVSRDEYLELGITDAAILYLCAMTRSGLAPTLLTMDRELANKANSLGYAIVDYRAYME